MREHAAHVPDGVQALARRPDGPTELAQPAADGIRLADGDHLGARLSQADGDRIDLSAIDADATRPGNQAFWFADGVQFIAAQPGVVTTERQADITVVRADTGAAVLTLVVQGRVEFTAADFVL